jgi:UDP-glucose 4-epimerase
LGLDWIEPGKSIALNVGTGKGYSVKEVISTIEKVTGRKVPSKLAPRRPGDPPALIADPACAERLLNWKASRSLDDIVSTAWKWAERKTG